MPYTTVLFDLDGTLLNTLSDLHGSTNRALSQFGFPARTIDEIRAFVGNGIQKLIDRAVPCETDDKTRGAVLEAFKTDYAVHCADETAPYEGILSMLETLKEKNIKTAIVSNKADFAVKALARQYFPGLVTTALGESPLIPKKPDPAMIRAVLDELGSDSSKALFVGDSDVDFDTAMNAGIDAVLVDWGFRSRDLLLEKLEALPKERRGSVVSSTDELLSVIL